MQFFRGCGFLGLLSGLSALFPPDKLEINILSSKEGIMVLLMKDNEFNRFHFSGEKSEIKYSKHYGKEGDGVWCTAGLTNENTD